MRNINKILIGVTIAGAGIATVGIGAGADFVDSPTATQHITTGTLLMTLSNSGNSSTSTAVTPANIALPAMSNEPSNFKNYQDVKVTNSGTLPGTVKSLVLSDSGDTGSLGQDASTVISINGLGYDYSQLCSGSIASCTGKNLLASLPPIVVPVGDSYDITFSNYAGDGTGFASLTNQDEGKVLDETLTQTISNTTATG